MAMKMPVLLSTVTMAVLLSGCGAASPTPPTGCKVTGKGARVTKDMSDTLGQAVGQYTKIAFGDGFTATVSMSDTDSFKLETFKNTLAYMDISVQGDTLNVAVKPYTCNHQSKVTIGVKNVLQGLVSSGGSNVNIDQLQGSINVNGGSNVVVSDTLTVTSAAAYNSIGITGGSTVQVATCNADTKFSSTLSQGSTLTVHDGTVASAQLTAADGSTFALKNLDVQSATVTESGGSHVTGMTIDTLTLYNSGGSGMDSFVKTRVTGSCSGGGALHFTGGADTSGLSLGTCTLQPAAQIAV